MSADQQEDPEVLRRMKRSMSEELAEEEEAILRSIARSKSQEFPEELLPAEGSTGPEEPAAEKSTNAEQGERERELIKCPEPGCSKSFVRPCDLHRHQKAHTRPIKCPEPTCKFHDIGFPTSRLMTRHFNDKHSETPTAWECLFKPCTFMSKRKSNRDAHMEKMHGWTYVRNKTNGKDAEDEE